MSAQLSATLWSTIVGSGTLVRPLIQLLKFPFSVPPKKFFDTARSLQPRLQIVSEAVAYAEHGLPGSEQQLVDTLAERSVFEEFVVRTHRVLRAVSFRLLSSPLRLTAAPGKAFVARYVRQAHGLPKMGLSCRPASRQRPRCLTKTSVARNCSLSS